VGGSPRPGGAAPTTVTPDGERRTDLPH